MNQNELALKSFEEKAKNLESSSDRWRIMLLLEKVRKDLRFQSDKMSFKQIKKEVES